MGARAGFVVAATVAAFPAAPSVAAVARTRTVCENAVRGCADHTYVTYVAAAGERNDVSLRLTPRWVTISDRVPITARGNCMQLAPTRVRCSGATVNADLGDLDDTADGTSTGMYVSASIHGGPGDDRLTGHQHVGVYGDDGNDVVSGPAADGGNGQDMVTGTGGDDLLSGGPGEDMLYGGPGDDKLNGDGTEDSAHDILEGGPGTDVASYSGRTERVEVDLGMRTGGYPGEDDALHDIEGAEGGAGPDYLVGDDGPNTLDGGDCSHDTPDTPADTLFGSNGDDRLIGSCTRDAQLYGGAGNDALLGGPRNDLLDGGPGDDFLGGNFGLDSFQGGDGADRIASGDIVTGNGGREKANCGPGEDVAQTPGSTLLHNDCELVDLSFGLVTGAYPTRPRPAELDFTIRCPRRRACRGSLALKLAHERQPFVTRKFRRRHGVAHLRFALPSRVTSLTDASVPIRATLLYHQKQREYVDADFSGYWVFDLAETPVQPPRPA